MSRVVTSAIGQVVLGHRHRRAVVAVAGDPGERAGRGAVEGDELAAVLAVEAEVTIGLLDDAVGLAGDDVAVFGDADVDALAAAAQGEHHRAGTGGAGRTDRDRAIEPGDGAAERLDDTVPIGARGRAVAGDERRDHLGVGGDRSGDAQAVGAALRSAWLSTSPLSTPTTYGPVSSPPDSSSSSLLTGWALASEMMPTLAQRVCPSTDTSARSPDTARRSSVVGGDLGTHRRRVVAELTDLRRRLVHEREHGAGSLAPSRSRTEPAWNSGSLDRSAIAAATARVGDVEGVIPDEDVEPCRVASAHLHPVDRRQCLLDRQVAGPRRR